MTAESALRQEKEAAAFTAPYTSSSVFEINAQAGRIQTAANYILRVGELPGRLSIGRNVEHFLLGGPKQPHNAAYRFKHPQFEAFFKQHAIMGSSEAVRLASLLVFAHTTDEAFLNAQSPLPVPAFAAVPFVAAGTSRDRRVCFRCGSSGHAYRRCTNPSPPAAPMCPKCSVAHWGVLLCPPAGADLVSFPENGSAR
jgi:hypothetical protein